MHGDCFLRKTITRHYHASYDMRQEIDELKKSVSIEIQAGAEAKALLVKEEAFKRSLERELGETKSQVCQSAFPMT